MIGVDGFDFDGRDKDTVWTEGTEGVALVALVALAYWSIGYSTEGDYFHEQVARLHDVAGDGGIPYTTNLGTIYFDEASLSVQYPSVAGTAWFLFYEKQFNPFRPNLWHNLANAYDVDGNGRVEPLDVLTLINYINAHPGNTALPSPPAWPPPPPYYDVNNDGQITPLDVLWVINYINSHPSASGEGEAVSRIASSDEPPCLPSFEVPLVPLLTIAAAPEVGSGTATNNADSWPATWPPLVSVQPHDGQPPSASPMATPAVRDSLLRPATRPVMLDDLDGVLAPFDGVLRDIADDVARGWGQDGGAP
jgi:hypothetical protein